ncbi:MAG TPA: helix-hairpin-helix domain-containing protein [Sphingobacterium sp.]|nr:helix-hairpin-helix domain-containing protein [Sphingobacterium sp.]
MDFKPIFSLTRKERSAFFIIILLIIISFIAPWLYRNMRKSQDMEVFIEYLKDSVAEIEEEEVEEQLYSDKKEIQYFDFDPNTLSRQEWVRLGLSEAQADVVLYYQERGGRFRDKEDLKKVYVISDEFYIAVEPYIQIIPGKEEIEKENKFERSGNFEKKTTENTSKKDEADYKININAADTTEWKKIRGIGPVLSQRIINFKKALGGFYSIDQIKEVYGIEEELFQAIKPKLTLSDSNNYNKIDINVINEVELAKHPYVNRKEAKIIVNYRMQHGDFEHFEEIRKIKGINLEKVSKVFPYLSFKKAE